VAHAWKQVPHTPACQFLSCARAAIAKAAAPDIVAVSICRRERRVGMGSSIVQKIRQGFAISTTLSDRR
jgi:hypothetical protein